MLGEAHAACQLDDSSYLWCESVGRIRYFCFALILFRDQALSRVLRAWLNVFLVGMTLILIYRQDPVECIFSFICSSNNNIPRITSMLGNLRRTYGEPLLGVGDGGLAATGVFGTNAVRNWPFLISLRMLTVTRTMQFVNSCCVNYRGTTFSMEIGRCGLLIPTMDQATVRKGGIRESEGV